MQKQMKSIVIGLVAAFGTSFAVADSAQEPASNVINSPEYGHAAHAPGHADQGLSTAEWRYVGGEPAWIHEVGKGGSRRGKSRAEVQRELIEFQSNHAAQLRHLSLYIRG